MLELSVGISNQLATHILTTSIRMIYLSIRLKQFVLDKKKTTKKSKKKLQHLTHLISNLKL